MRKVFRAPIFFLFCSHIFAADRFCFESCIQHRAYLPEDFSCRGHGTLPSFQVQHPDAEEPFNTDFSLTPFAVSGKILLKKSSLSSLLDGKSCECEVSFPTPLRPKNYSVAVLLKPLYVEMDFIITEQKQQKKPCLVDISTDSVCIDLQKPLDSHRHSHKALRGFKDIWAMENETANFLMNQESNEWSVCRPGPMCALTPETIFFKGNIERTRFFPPKDISGTTQEEILKKALIQAPFFGAPACSPQNILYICKLDLFFSIVDCHAIVKDTV